MSIPTCTHTTCLALYLDVATHLLSEELEISENAREELEKRVKEIGESLKSTQDHLEELKKEKEILDGDREAELSFIQEVNSSKDQ